MTDTAPVITPGTAPASPGASVSTPSGTPPVAAPRPAKGAPTAAAKQPTQKAAREPVLWRRGVKEDGTPDELDVSGFVDSYERELTIDGKKQRVHIDDAFTEYAKGRVADRRLSEHDREKRAFEAERTQFRETVNMLSIDPKDPTSGPRAFDFAARMLSKRFGAENFETFIVQQFAHMAKIAKLPEAERQAIAREQALREDLDRRELEVRAGKAEIERHRQEKAEAERKATNERIRKEWPPLLTEYGAPEAWVGRGMREMVAEIRKMRDLKTPISEAQAARIVGKRLQREAAALRPPAQAALEQPGRETPPAEKQPNGVGKPKEPQRNETPDDVRKRLWGG